MSEPREGVESQQNDVTSGAGKARAGLGRAGRWVRGRWVRGRSARWVVAGAAVVVIGGGAAAVAVHHEHEGHGGGRWAAAGDQERYDGRDGGQGEGRDGGRDGGQGGGQGAGRDREGHRGHEGRTAPGHGNEDGRAGHAAPAPLPSTNAADALAKAASVVTGGRVESLTTVAEQGGGRAWRAVVIGADGVRHAVTVDGATGSVTGNTVLGG
ncbi:MULTISPECIES: hypothetical protein [unclassified Kitasatospora]|uniref:hypothetical protein n=1 Tax=unclassified Kitasatospora TaxID=2633591 RepID=UPI0033E80042